MEYREFRAEVTETEGNKLSGVLAPFGSETTIGRLDSGGWREEIAPGAFAKALNESDTVLLCDHDMSKPLARVSAGTLRLREDGDALRFDADIVDTSYARDVMANVRAKNKKGMSIGFEPVKDEWYHADGRPATRLDGVRRVLREVKLPEGSVVTNPAYKDTSVYARDDSAALLEERAARAPEVTVTGTDYTDMAAQLIRAYNELPDELKRTAEALAEQRASSVSAADRKALAAKGHALSDGSYPIPDKEHLHAAAVLAASHHGNWQAAKALIRKMAKLFKVALSSLPGFGKEDNEEPFDTEVRDDPDGKEFAAIDAACDWLEADPPNVAEALSALLPCRAGTRPRSEELPGESRDDQEPDSSTPEDDEDYVVALREMEHKRSHSREAGLV